MKAWKERLKRNLEEKSNRNIKQEDNQIEIVKSTLERSDTNKNQSMKIGVDWDICERLTNLQSYTDTITTLLAIITILLSTNSISLSTILLRIPILLSTTPTLSSTPCLHYKTAFEVWLSLQPWLTSHGNLKEINLRH